MIQATVPLYFFIVAFGTVVISAMIWAPYSLHKEERDRAEALALKLEPRLSFSLLSSDGAKVSIGGTSQSWMGNRQSSARTARQDALSILVENRGTTAVKNCQAALTKVEPIDVPSWASVVEPVLLSWDPVKTEENLSKDLPAGSKSRFWLTDSTLNGNLWLVRDLKSLPLEYRHIFGSPGTYKTTIVVSGDNMAPQQIDVELESRQTHSKEKGDDQDRFASTIAIKGVGTPSQ